MTLRVTRPLIRCALDMIRRTSPSHSTSTPWKQLTPVRAHGFGARRGIAEPHDVARLLTVGAYGTSGRELHLGKRRSHGLCECLSASWTSA